MTKNLYIVLVVAVAVALGSFLLLSRPSDVTAPQSGATGSINNSAPTPTSPTAVTPQPSTEVIATITYTNNGFSLSTLTIKAGTVVAFQNKSSSPSWPASAIHPTHAVYDGTSLLEHCQNGTSDTFDHCKGINPGESWSFRFDKIGSWKYHNHLNAGEKGVIVVQ